MNSAVTSDSDNSQLKQFPVSLSLYDAMVLIQKFHESKILPFVNVYLNHRSTIRAMFKWHMQLFALVSIYY